MSEDTNKTEEQSIVNKPFSLEEAVKRNEDRKRKLKEEREQKNKDVLRSFRIKMG